MCAEMEKKGKEMKNKNNMRNINTLDNNVLVSYVFLLSSFLFVLEIINM